MARVAAYRFRIGVEAWDQFVDAIGVDGAQLVSTNYLGYMLDFAEPHIMMAAPTVEQMLEILARLGHADPPEAKKIMSARDLARSWKDLYEKVCRD
jgi:hypothetical protein